MDKTSISSEVKRQLAQRRTTAEERQKSARHEIYSKLPELYDIDNKTAQLASTIPVSAMQTNGIELISQLKNDITALQQEKKSLLLSNGFSPDNLSVKYHCETCQDTGVDQNKKCHCYHTLYQQISLQNLPAMAMDNSLTFENFDLSFYGTPDTDDYQKMEKILNICKRFAENNDESKKNLLLLGKTGLGKTHLSVAIMTEFGKDGHFVKYTSAQGLIDLYQRIQFGKSEFDKPDQAAFDSKRDLLAAKLLVIDDLGSELVNSFTQNVVYTVINDRMTAGLHTIISTNFTGKQLNEIYNERIVSRILHNYTALPFSGQDVRYLKKISGIR